jgi:hypothetical protein
MAPYLNEPVALLLGDQLSSAITTAQAMAENAIALEEEITPSAAMQLHQQLVELEACIARAAGLTPIES